MSEVEPRRSVRSTKGQHSKSLDELEQQQQPKRRQNKKNKKAQEEEQQSQDGAAGDDEEIIRCVCGATEQDDDSGEAWISCEKCFAWQHNVCVGVSSFEDEIPEFYWCEQCKPENHKELLEGMKKGEKPWEARRQAHEEQKKKPRKGGRKGGRGKRQSEAKEDNEKVKQESAAAPDSTPAAPPATETQPEQPAATESAAKSATPAPAEAPAPEAAPAEPTPEKPTEKKDSPVKGKRKTREEETDATDGKASKVRKLSPEPSAPKPPAYIAPEDIAQGVKELPTTRSGPAKALKKSIGAVLDPLVKNKKVTVPEGSSADAMAEAFAIQIERAVFDTHPAVKGQGQKEYSNQIKSLVYNLKNNAELVPGLISGRHTPTTLAVMTSAQLASAQQLRDDAEALAKAEAQSTLPPQDLGRARIRRTHKGEEIVEDETMTNAHDPPPRPAGTQVRKPSRQDGADGKDAAARPIKNEPGAGSEQPTAGSPGPDGPQRTPSQSNFDIGKVFSSVRSSSVSQPRRPSAPINTNGPGDDPEVDRMLQDETDSPPYSPKEADPDVVWHGKLTMSTIADFAAKAKYVAGADFQGMNAGPWSNLIPYHLSVAGRIAESSATEYLCSLRYSNLTDIVVVSLEPESEDSRSEFNAMINYFTEKKRFGVLGEKAAGNVRDTYLIPLPAGTDNYPEFVLNLHDNYIPRVRDQPMMLVALVWKSDPEVIKNDRDKNGNQPRPPTLTMNRAAAAVQKNGGGIPSGGPGFSPATPIAPPFGSPSIPQTQTPVPAPRPASTQSDGQTLPHAPLQQQSNMPPQAWDPYPTPEQLPEEKRYAAQQAGEAIAAEILGPFFTAPTVRFVTPQAWKMYRKEWEVLRDIYNREPRSREDLLTLSGLLSEMPSHNATAAAATAAAINVGPPAAAAASASGAPPAAA